jgi:aryl-alcohol dehydrogenase-like predicted oxidoreductase
VFGWGSQNGADVLGTMRHALEAGVNWIDTTAGPGLGQSEELVGQLVRELPAAARPFVFTTCGLARNAHGRAAAPAGVLTPASIQRECEGSLRRLGVERIDLYQFHCPCDAGAAVDDSWAAMTNLIEQGKIRAAGLSDVDVRLLDRCEAIGHVDALQPPFSLIDRTAAERELPWCASHDTGVICYSPIQSGLLTDSFTAERVTALAGDDWRRLALTFRLREALRPIATRHGTSVSALAIAWTLAWPGVTGAIVGARTPGQVDGWIDAASIRLRPEDLDAVATAIQRTGAGSGPVTSGQPHALPQAGPR